MRGLFLVLSITCICYCLVLNFFAEGSIHLMTPTPRGYFLLTNTCLTLTFLGCYLMIANGSIEFKIYNIYQRNVRPAEKVLYPSKELQLILLIQSQFSTNWNSLQIDDHRGRSKLSARQWGKIINQWCIDFRQHHEQGQDGQSSKARQIRE